jgi:hypothetical protein
MGQMSRPDLASSTYCYSTGVIEVWTTPDAGTETNSFTKTDGHTLCYKVLRDPPSYVFRYYDEANALVATVEALMPNSVSTDYAVTCDGATVTVTAAQQQSPECRVLGPADCKPGTCP